MFGKRKRDEDPEEFDGFEEYGEYADDDGYMPDEYADGNGPDDYTEDYGTDGYAEDDFGEMPPEDAPPYSDMNDGWDREMPEDADGEEKKPEPRSIFRPATRKPNFVVSVLVNTVRVIIVLAMLAGVAGLGALTGIAKGYVDTSPELDLVALDSPDQNTIFYDCNKKVLTKYHGTENREVVPLASIPKRLRNAFIAVEDARFYSHNGVDLIRIGGALISNLTTSGTQGGSTITQQLIKNTLLSSEQSYKRKIQEAWLAIRLEMNTKYTKDDILQSYLNTIYLGESYYGVKVAAKGYFDKELDQLTIRECAMLAGMTNNPYYYNPRRNFYRREGEDRDFKAVTNDRTDYVLECMYKNKYITAEEYEQALNYSEAHVLEYEPSSTSSGMYQYPHYIEYAVKETVQILLEINKLPDTSVNRAAMEEKLRTGGYHIQLAIDPTIQETVESTLQNWAKYPSLRDPSDKVYRSRNADGTYTDIQQPQAACVVLDYRTGELKAIVGSRDEVKARKTLNRATDMKMPVGSAIKPISVYAPALELGASPASVVYNIPVPISGWKDAKGNDSWPTNYGGGGYTGPETLKTAMMHSHNTSAAQTLMTMVGVDRSVDFLHRLGVDDDHIDATPFGLSLGSSGITPLQMTVAYGTLANGGVYKEPISVIGISDSEGHVVWDGHQHQERRLVFSGSTAYMIVDMLKAVVEGSGGTGKSAKISNQVVGGKTGTNSDQKGVFFAGVTGYYSSALWIGHDNYKALSSKSTGSGAAAPLWQAYMSKIHEGLPKREILDGKPSDYGLVQVETCTVSGQLATAACRNDDRYGTVKEYWAEGTQPTQYCQMHSTQVVCTETGMLACPNCPLTTEKAVVVIPVGHPLYNLLGTEYRSVLEDYLGSTVTSASGQTCTLHMNDYSGDYSGGYPGGENGGGGEAQQVPDQRLADARQLIATAEAQLMTLDPGGAQYSAIVNAASQLQSLIDSGTASAADITNAMTTLTRAMAGIF